MNTSEPLVVACDESGNDGENLLYGSSPVFTHASVTLSWEEASGLMAEIRTRTQSQSIELKSKTLLLGKNEATAKWFLEHAVLEGQASLHITHKRYFLVSKLFDATVEELANEQGVDLYDSGIALAGANSLHFLAPHIYGERWYRFLSSFQFFLRAKNVEEARKHLDNLVSGVDDLLSDKEAILRNLIGTMSIGLKHLKSLSALQLGQGITERLRTGDPLLAAVGATVMFWAHFSGRPVQIVHDAAKELTPSRVDWMQFHLARPELVASSRKGAGVDLVGLTLVNSMEDPRVQVADLLAGLARVVGEQMDSGEEHPLLRYVSEFINEFSIWPIQEYMNIQTAREAMSGRRARFE